MSEFYNFKTSAFGYDKEEVNDVVLRLLNENKEQKQQIDTISRLLEAKQDEQSSNGGVIIQYETKIRSLEDKIHQLEYQLYQLNETYQELQSHSNRFASILASANQTSDRIIEQAKVQANDILTQSEDEFIAQLPSATLLQSDLSKLNYFKANRNLAIIKQAIIMLQEKLNLMLDDMDHQENRLSEIKVNE